VDRPAPNTATCVCVGVYAQALTFGNEYAILSHDPGKGQVEVRGDNGRKRWFPSYCFDLTGQPVVKLVRMTTEDPLDGSISPEVVLEFSDGQRRWCYFTTPELLAQFGGDAQFDGERLLSYSPHMIVLSGITRGMIEHSLAYIESQGQLLDCSMPV